MGSPWIAQNAQPDDQHYPNCVENLLEFPKITRPTAAPMIGTECPSQVVSLVGPAAWRSYAALVIEMLLIVAIKHHVLGFLADTML